MTLADEIIEHGPYAQDYLIGPGFAGPLRWLRAAEINALREELIELRQIQTSRGLGHTAGCVAGVACEPYCEAQP